MALNFLLVNFPYYVWGKLNFTRTLALIGWCYLIAALIYLYTGWRTQLALVFVALATQWAALGLLSVPGHGAGVLLPQANAATYIDHVVFSPWFEPSQGGELSIVILPTVGAVATTLIGVLAGHWLRSARKLSVRLCGLFAVGLLLFLLGSAWHLVLPVNKQLWTASYVVLMAGIAMLLLAAVSWFSELRGYRAWAKPLQIAGVNALFLYVFAQSLQRVLVYGRISTEDGAVVRLRYFLYERFFEPLVSGEFGALVYALVFMSVCYSVVLVLYRRRIFLKL